MQAFYFPFATHLVTFMVNPLWPIVREKYVKRPRILQQFEDLIKRISKNKRKKEKWKDEENVDKKGAV